MQNTNVDKLIETFSLSLAIDKALIVDELKYNSIPQWDSVAHMVLIAGIESAFDVMLETDDIIDMSSVLKAKEILKKLGIDFNA